MVAARPFIFTSLPRLTKAQAALQQSLALYLAQAPLQPDFSKKLTQTLSDLLKEPTQISAAELGSVSRSELGALLPALGCLIVLGAAPTPHKIIVDVDSVMAAGAIERLLGGDGRAERLSRAFTEVECGVLSYGVLRLLSLLEGAWETGRELSLGLDRFASTLDELEPLIHDESGYQLLSFRLQVGPRHAYARVLIPDPLIGERFGAALPQSQPTPQDRLQMRRCLAALGDCEVTASLQGARIDLSTSDMAHVEAGDIILLENHQLRQTADGIVGELFVSMGRGKNGGIKAELFCDASQPDQARLRILSFVNQEEPVSNSDGKIDFSSEAGPDASAPADSGQETDNLAETESLLRDIEAPLVVELGRIKLNTAQVVRLRAGQILRLTRGPNDPVDLVVNGKLFARGELIEVEGELGVKLLHVPG
jgi:type III secretion system YscQ/HrcQ family protein